MRAPLEHLRARLAVRKLDLVLSEAAKVVIADAGFDPAYGARPLKRVIQRMIADPLAKELLSGRFPEGGTVNASEDGLGGLLFDFVPSAIVA